jgi:multidrug efflux system membrane fusion protein
MGLRVVCPGLEAYLTDNIQRYDRSRSTMRIFPLITAAIVVAVLYFVIFERDRALEWAGAGGDAAQVAAETEAAPQLQDASTAFRVVAVRSTATEISSFVLVRGRTEAARQVDVRSETSGKVISDPLPKGSIVETGQLLCQLDPGTRQVSLAEAQARLPEARARVPEAQARVPEAQARLAEAEARLTEAEINLNAANKLAVGGFASETRVAAAESANESAMAAVQSARAGLASAESGIQAAEAGIQAAEVGIAAAEREIEQLSIKAPFGGFLESDTAETGALLQPGALCATVIQLDPVNLLGFVPETEVSRVRAGAPAGARLSGGEETVGQVTFISRAADPNTRTFRVEVTIPNPDGAIRDGQTVEIGISTDGQTAHLLPMSALTLDDDGNAGVRLVDETSKAKFAPVAILRDTTQGIWVSGLPATADIIVVGQEYVTDGVPVQATYREVTQ